MKIVKQTKKLISDNGVYQVYAELSEVDGVINTRSLKFKTVWSDARDPLEEHVKFEMFLTDEQLTRLKELL